MHDAWSAWIVNVHPYHRSLKPFAELSPETQRMDDLYVDAIHRACAEDGQDRPEPTDAGPDHYAGIFTQPESD